MKKPLSKKKKKRESGQAMVEFALVLPIFLLLVMGIIDFGFLFYNYTSMENAARNAARVACVQYGNIQVTTEEVASEEDPGVMVTKTHYVRTLQIPEENPTSKLSYGGTYTTAERDICIKVAESLEHTGIDKSGRVITIQYTYDQDNHDTDGGWNINKRYDGDVIVTVTGDSHVLTPVLGVMSDDMKKPLSTSSTFKVEQQYTSATTSSVGP